MNVNFCHFYLTFIQFSTTSKTMNNFKAVVLKFCKGLYIRLHKKVHTWVYNHRLKAKTKMKKHFDNRLVVCR